MGFSYLANLAFVFNFLCPGIFGTFEKQVKNKDFEGVGTVFVKKQGCCDCYVMNNLDIGTLLLSMYCSIVFSHSAVLKNSHIIQFCYILINSLHGSGGNIGTPSTPSAMVRVVPATPASRRKEKLKPDLKLKCGACGQVES